MLKKLEKPEGLCSVATEKKMGNNLFDSQKRLLLAHKASNNGIIEWNLITDEVCYSPRWKTLIGYAENEIKNDISEWKNRIHPEDIQKVTVSNSLFSEKGTNRVELEYRLKHKDGMYRWIKSKTICLRNEHDKPDYLVSSHTDISAQKKAEQEIIELNEKLEQRVMERTLLLKEANTALKVLLEKREESKDEISGSIISNYEILVKPVINNLKKSLTSKKQKNLVDILASNLFEIFSPFSKKLINQKEKFTQTEVQVADLVKTGYTNKEIAEILDKSTRAVAAHRENIRNKLGIQNKKINLRAFLSNIK